MRCLYRSYHLQILSSSFDVSTKEVVTNKTQDPRESEMAAKASTVSTSNVLSANTEIEISKKSIETASSKISRPLEEMISRPMEENQKKISRPLEENISRPLEENLSRPLEENRPICVVTVLGLALQPGGVASNQVIVIL